MKVSTLACILGAYASSDNPKRILDIGAGTGLLSLMVAQRFNAAIDAVEIDPDAYEQAKTNIRMSPWPDRIHVVQNDIKEFAREQHPKYDLVLTNPPFFTNQLSSPDSKINLARHDQGLTIEQLSDTIPELLNATGTLVVLLPPEETYQLSIHLKKHNIFISGQLAICNYLKARPLAYITNYMFQTKKNQKGTLNIRNDDDKYSDQFISLLKDYYLYL